MAKDVKFCYVCGTSVINMVGGQVDDNFNGYQHAVAGIDINLEGGYSILNGEDVLCSTCTLARLRHFMQHGYADIIEENEPKVALVLLKEFEEMVA